jgi:hypothetical protein
VRHVIVTVVGQREVAHGVDGDVCQRRACGGGAQR